MRFIDDFLNGITMYRLMLYFLVLLTALAVVLSFFKLLPFEPLTLLASTLFLLLISQVLNTIWAQFFQVPANVESSYITALILSLVTTPVRSVSDLLFLSLIATLAISSKYLLVIHKKHLFNPAALGVTLGAVFLQRPASWWVGSEAMIPATLVGGALIARKIRRVDLVLPFFAALALTTTVSGLVRGVELTAVFKQLALESPALFFATVMLTEPLTTPPSQRVRVIYGTMVGLISAYLTPEFSLLVGNLFSYLASPGRRLSLQLKEKKQLATDIYHFVFSSEEKLNFLPGQYLEWTLGHKNPDSRGNRRYFTIASSPTEQDLAIGVKFPDHSSSFKRELLSQKVGNRIVATQLAGDFTLPKDSRRKLVFVAGGIGITPFRSMIKYLLDTQKERDIVLFYSCKTADEIVYKDIFDQATGQVGLRTVYTLTDKDQVPDSWKGRVGYIDEKMVRGEVQDFGERVFYLSGPHSLVTAFEKVLKDMGLGRGQIKTDFFPGYA